MICHTEYFELSLEYLRHVRIEVGGHRYVRTRIEERENRSSMEQTRRRKPNKLAGICVLKEKEGERILSSKSEKTRERKSFIYNQMPTYWHDTTSLFFDLP